MQEDTNPSQSSKADRVHRSVSPYKAGLLCRCPACGKDPLFHNILEVHTFCPGCGFDLSAADPGDGAQVFVILILGGLLTLLGFLLAGGFGFSLPVVLAILGVVAIVGSLWMLRVFKATLIALQFHHDAHEGRLDGDQDQSK